MKVGDLVQHVTATSRVGIVTNIGERGYVTGVWLYDPPTIGGAARALHIYRGWGCRSPSTGLMEKLYLKARSSVVRAVVL